MFGYPRQLERKPSASQRLSVPQQFHKYAQLRYLRDRDRAIKPTRARRPAQTRLKVMQFEL